jgi:hypothetical protein
MGVMMYINNKKLLELICDYHKTNIVSEELHLLMFNLAKNVASKSNWKDYTWKEDMISDAYLKCILKLDKFDMERDNAFGYFTTLINNFYIDVVKKYKKSEKLVEKLKTDHINRLEMQYNVFYNRKNHNNFHNN